LILGALQSEAIPRKDFDDLKEQLERMPKDVDRLRLIRRVALNYSMSCAELKELVEVQRFGSGAVDTVVLVYPKLRDPELVENVVIASFKYQEDKDAIKTRLAPLIKK